MPRSAIVRGTSSRSTTAPARGITKHVEATGRSEAEALRDLVALLREWRVEHAPERPV
jgi:hypothetical protein